MPTKKSPKKIKKATKKNIEKNVKTKTLVLANRERNKKFKNKEKSYKDYSPLKRDEECVSPEEWMEKEAQRVELEFKEYAADLKVDSGKSPEECAQTAMTLAHHGTEEAIEALKKFKEDSRAPMWIDCGIEECEMILWENTTGRQLEKAEEKLREAAEEVFAEKLNRDKEMIVNALKETLTKQKIKFTCENNNGLVIDDVLLVEIKPSFADWIMRFKNGLEGENLQREDLEKIEQEMFFGDKEEEPDEPKTLQKIFDEFYKDYFYSLLETSKKPEGILLDFSGEKLYGEYFHLPKNIEATGNTVNYGHCSGWCEGCFEELKCETAQEWKEEEDKKRYRILKGLMKEMVEIEKRIKSSKQPSADLEYQMEIAEKIKSGIQEKIYSAQKTGKSKEEVEKLKNDFARWDMEIAVFQNLIAFEQPKSEDLERLQTLKEMYQTIKEEVETREYKNDVEGLEAYYGKAEPSSEENASCYHDPLCECGEYEPFSLEESEYKNPNEDDEICENEIPF